MAVSFFTLCGNVFAGCGASDIQDRLTDDDLCACGCGTPLWADQHRRATVTVGQSLQAFIVGHRPAIISGERVYYVRPGLSTD